MPAPRYDRQIAVDAGGAVNRAAGADSSALEQTLEQFSQNRAAAIAQRNTERAFLAGQQSGGQGGPADATELTSAGRAFNRGAMLAHQAAVQTDIRDSVGRYAIEHPEDPDGFQAKVDGLQEGLLKEADPRMQPFIRERLADYAGRAKLGIIEAQQQKLRKDALGDLRRGSEGLFDDASTAAFEGNVPLAEARRQEYHALLQGGVDGKLLTEGEAGELRKKFEHEVTQQEVVGNFDRLVRDKGVDAGRHSIERWQATKPSDVNLSADEHEAVTRQLITLQNRQESLLADASRQRNAALAAEYEVRKSRVEDAVKVLREGFPQDQAGAKTIAEDLRWMQGIGTPLERVKAGELARDYDTAQAIQSQVYRFRRMPPAARAAELDRLESHLRTGGANADQVQLLQSLKTTSAFVDRQLESDPRGFANSEGLIQDAPLDFSEPGKLVDSINARANNADIGKHLIGRPLPRFTEAEAHQLGEVYKNSEIEQKSALLGVITAGSGPDALATLGQLDKTGNKRMAILGSMVMQGQGQVARDVMRGEQVLAGAKEVKPKVSDYGPDVEDSWGSALGDWPEQRGQYLDAAIAKYAELKASAGDLSDKYEASMMRQALEAVMPTAEFNDRRVAVPPGVSEKAFEQWVDSWKPEDFKGIAGVADPAEALRLVKHRGRLVELGAGRYGVLMDSALSGRDKVLVRAPAAADPGAAGEVSADARTAEPFVLEYPMGGR